MKASELAAALAAVEENAELLKGETGEKGFTGERGPMGPQGPEGPEGPQGERGPIGPQGIMGLTGPKGDKGDKGLRGEAGRDGRNGETGAPGRDGERGERGPAGPPATGPATVVRGIFGGGGGGSGGGSALEVMDDGASLDTAVTSLDFAGTGVTATAVGHAITVTVPTPTNITGNAATVTTNANLSGDVSSSGNTTTIGAGKVTEAMQVLANNTTQDVSTSKHGYAPKAPNDATKYLDGTGAYSTPASGGVSLPTFVQTKQAATNTSTTLTMDAAPTNGNVLVLGTFCNGSAGFTSVTQTNVTWTKMATGAATTATVNELWVGKVSGVGGTGITIVRTAGANAIWRVIEVSGVTVTPTAGQTANVVGNHPWPLNPAIVTVTTGHFVILSGGDTNQSTPTFLTPSIPVTGVLTGMPAVACGYSLGGIISATGYTTSSNGGGIIVCEVT